LSGWLSPPVVFLAVSVWGAAFTAIALLPGRQLSGLVVPYFFGAWLTSELPLHHLAWQVVATIAFVALGALEAPAGWVGLGITLASWGGLLVLHRRADTAAPVLREALSAGLAGSVPSGEDDLGSARRLAAPFSFRHPAIERVRDLAYHDEHGRHRLDLHRPRERDGLCPTLFQIHGGGWVVGRKDHQALPLMTHLAERGWGSVATNYRLSPHATYPEHLIDVKRALAWIRRYGPEHGVDPSFIVVTGGSAGGHLAAMVALTANDPALQPGFEEVDTSVAACVPFYGVYDFLDRHGVRGRQSMRPFLERVVMKSCPDADREAWDAASPIARVHAGAPPFFVIHGTHDSLVHVEETRHFVDALRRVSHQPVLYAEIPGAQHAFEMFHSLRTAHTVRAVTHFVEHVRAAQRVAAPEMPRPAQLES
jgi:acetyl esterase/lipase